MARMDNIVVLDKETGILQTFKWNESEECYEWRVYGTLKAIEEGVDWRPVTTIGFADRLHEFRSRERHGLAILAVLGD